MGTPPTSPQDLFQWVVLGPLRCADDDLMLYQANKTIWNYCMCLIARHTPLRLFRDLRADNKIKLTPIHSLSFDILTVSDHFTL